MSVKTGRNEPCPCGSGKKYKMCCENKSVGSDVVSGGGGILFLVLLLVTGAGAATFFWVGGNSPVDEITPEVVRQPISTPTPGAANAGGTNQPILPPPGPPPPGKVWSPEHGHWHDAGGGATGTTIPVGAGGVSPPSQQARPQPPGQQARPQPPGPPPPGKVWSPEHGHWHDAP